MHVAADHDCTGVHVQIWDMGMQVNEVTAAEDERVQRGRPHRQEPQHVHRHSTEGFALDWSRAAAGRLASGDCRRGIHVWDANEKGNWSVSGRYQVCCTVPASN